jgi:hypothetical protein
MSPYLRPRTWINGISKTHRVNWCMIAVFYSLILSVIMVAGLISCGLVPKEVIATGVYAEDPNHVWKVTSEIFQGSRRYSLRSNLIAIVLDFYRDPTGKYFQVGTSFRDIHSDDMTFNPSLVTMRLPAGDHLKVDAYCPGITLWGSQNSKRDCRFPYIIHLNRSFSVYTGSIVFAHPPPSIEEETVMYMNDALTSDGKKLEIPPIHFRNTIEHNFQFGLVQ